MIETPDGSCRKAMTGAIEAGAERFRPGQRVRPTDSNPFYHRYRKKGAKVTMVSVLDRRYLQVNGDWWAAHFWKPWREPHPNASA